MRFDNATPPLIPQPPTQARLDLDKSQLPAAMANPGRRALLKPFNLASLGYFVMNDLAEPHLAIPYFARAIEGAHPMDPFPQQLAAEFRAMDRPDLAVTIEKLDVARRRPSGT